MKARKFVLTLVGALLLSSCGMGGGKKSSDEGAQSAPLSSVPETSASPSSSTPEQIAQAALDDMLVKMANPKHKINIKVGTETLADMIVDGDACVFDEGDGDLYGVIKNNQGWFNYGINNNAVVLGDCIGVNKDVIPFPRGKDIADLGKEIYTVDAKDPKKFTSTNADLLTIAEESVGGYVSGVTLATMVVGDDNILFAFTYGAGDKLYLTFSDFGTASNAVVEAFLANPTDKAAPTAFNDYENQILDYLFKDEKNKVPYPSFATFGYSSDYNSQAGGMVMGDLAAGAAGLTSYGAQLVQNGYVLDEEESTANDKIYKLAATAENTYIVIEIMYMPAAQIPNPQYTQGLLAALITKKIDDGRTYTAESVANDINALFAADPDLANAALTESPQSPGNYATMLNCGECEELTEELAFGTATALRAYLPDYVNDISAGYYTKDDEGYYDLVGDQKPMFQYVGVTPDRSTMVSVMLFVMQGSLRAMIMVSPVPTGEQ